MIEKTLVYDVNGRKLISSLYRDGTGSAPAVLIFPDILGIRDHTRERAIRLANLGYIALAVDFHGDGARLSPEQAMGKLDAFYADPAVPLQRAQAGLTALCNQPGVDTRRIGAIGFCYGGTLALEFARNGADLAAVVGFHSALKTATPATPGRIQGKILVCIGSEDPVVPPADRHGFEIEMHRAEADWQLHLYGGVVHAFTDHTADQVGRPEFAKYDLTADRRSWTSMIALFGETLMP